MHAPPRTTTVHREKKRKRENESAREREGGGEREKEGASTDIARAAAILDSERQSVVGECSRASPAASLDVARELCQ